MWPQARLFGLLALLIPFFLGLQYLVQESVPQIEVRFIAPDAQTAAQAPAERVVERVVYVPVERTETAPLRQPASGLTQVAGRSSDSAKLSGLDATVAAAPPVQTGPLQAAHEQPTAEPVADEVASASEPVDEPQPHMGVVAVVTPAPAPVMAAALSSRAVAPARIVTAPAVAEPESVDGDAVADEATPEEPVEVAVAEAEPPAAVNDVAEIQVVETMLDGSQATTTRVVSYKIPVHQSSEVVQNEPEPAAPEATDESAAVEDEPAAVEDESGAVEDEQPVAVADDDEAPAWDADEAMKAVGPSDDEVEAVESDADEVAEAEPFEPTEAAVSTVSVTLTAEQGQ
jgi:hypothetical protein